MFGHTYSSRHAGRDTQDNLGPGMVPGADASRGEAFAHAYSSRHAGKDTLSSLGPGMVPFGGASGDAFVGHADGRQAGRDAQARCAPSARRAAPAAACAAAACAAAAACNELPLGALTSPRRGAQQRKSASAAACSRRAPSPGGSDSSPSVGDAQDRSPSPVQGIKAFEPNTSDLFLFGAKPPTLPLGDARRRPSVVTDEATLLDSVRHVASRREEQTMQKQVSCDLNPNVGTLQEVVFGYVGEGAKPLGEPPPEFPRKARLGRSTGPPLHWTANHRNEVGEIAFGKSAPDPELAAHRRRGVPVPPHQIPANAEWSPWKNTLVGHTVYHSADAYDSHGRAVGGRAPAESPAVQAAVMAAAAASARREAREARERGMSSGGLQFNGYQLPYAPPARKTAPHHWDTPHTEINYKKTASTFEFKGPEAIDPKGHGDGSHRLHSVVSGLPLAKPHHGRRATIELTDDPRPTERLHNRFAGKSSASNVAMKHEEPIRVPTGYAMRPDGTFAYAGVHAGKNFVSLGVGAHMPWRPEANAAEAHEEHQLRRAARSGQASEQDSVVDELVFGRDMDGSAASGKSAAALDVGDRPHRRSPPPGCRAAATSGPSLEWDETGEAAAAMDGRISPDFSRKGCRGMRGRDDHGSQIRQDFSRAEIESALAMPVAPGIQKGARGQRDRHSHGDLIEHDEGHLSERTGNLLEKMHGVDAHGRINASSVVDEALFGKSPMGGLIHTQNTQANFWMDARGGFAKR